MASDELTSVDLASLDAFRAELIEAGFEPTEAGGRRWQGPLHPALAEFTSEQTMRIYIRDGWPYRPPALHVRGIASEHAVLNGEVCLFQPGEHAVSAWLTFEAYKARIETWADRARDGFRFEDDLLDPHLYFRPKLPGLATLELAAIGAEGDEPKTGNLRGVWDHDRVLKLSTGSADGDELPGRWYYNPEVLAPPRDLAGFRDALTNGQRNNLERRLNRVQRDQREAVLALLWETRSQQRNCLVVVAKPGDSEPMLKSIELAPTDRQTLLLRAGPDNVLLASKRVVLFGVGAIGSHVANLLARAGLGELRAVDDDTLRPGNVVRHAGLPGFVGWSKGVATKFAIKHAAPWTKFEIEELASWNTDQLTEQISNHDLAVDATGLLTFTELLSRVALDDETPLISAALFRGGFLGRIRRQVPGLDTPFLERQSSEEYPMIPSGEEQIHFEAGCSAPVNNASPIAVAAISATAADVATDLLTDRLEYASELIDVYRPLESPPFDRIGRVVG